MRLRNTFVQFNTQARLRWWNHVPCFPLDRALHQLGLEPTPIQNTLLNQEVGTARRQLDVRGRFDWSCVKVWGHLGIVGFCHAGDLLRLEDPADAAQGGLEDCRPLPVEQLGELVFLELPETGKAVDKGDTLGEVESVKAVSDFYAPVSGTIVEVNANLPDALEPLQEDPLGEGWLVKIQVADASATDGMLDAAAYEEVVSDQS